MDKEDYYEIYANIDILATQEALFVMEVFPYTLKVTKITIVVELFSNFIPIGKILLPNLNKDFINHAVYH